MNSTRGKKCHKAKLKAEQLKSLRSRRKNRCRDVNQEKVFFIFVSSQSRTFVHSSYTSVVGWFRFSIRPPTRGLLIFNVHSVNCVIGRKGEKFLSRGFLVLVRDVKFIPRRKGFQFQFCCPRRLQPNTRTPDTRRRTQKCEV